LPDWRGDWCRSNYDLEVNAEKAKELDDVSVIICFHNEAWSTLLRSGWLLLMFGLKRLYRPLMLLLLLLLLLMLILMFMLMLEFSLVIVLMLLLMLIIMLKVMLMLIHMLMLKLKHKFIFMLMLKFITMVMLLMLKSQKFHLQFTPSSIERRPTFSGKFCWWTMSQQWTIWSVLNSN
jgi:hypothetical protein